MNENEERSFRMVFSFFSEWRDTVIETDEQWQALAEEIGDMIRISQGDQLMFNLLTAVLDYFTYLYKDGKKPMPAGYFGRDDLST